MNERGRENLLEVRQERTVEKQERIRLRNKTYVENNSFIFTNIHVIRRTRNY